MVKMIIWCGQCRLSFCLAAVQAANRWGPDETSEVLKSPRNPRLNEAAKAKCPNLL